MLDSLFRLGEDLALSLSLTDLWVLSAGWVGAPSLSLPPPQRPPQKGGTACSKLLYFVFSMEDNCFFIKGSNPASSTYLLVDLRSVA